MNDKSTERVKKHRKKKKARGYSQISIMLTEKAMNRLKMMKRMTTYSYSKIINFILNEEKF